ncbi:hypothetical protein [Streptomyces sp. HUAS TT20]|uniref:hypothetical protein n=1 Tax=Streptomyces sp. HUAS TT20 TaxID=3447509 RepID=UPI0021DB0CC3|nr:hypothetical protein [Streptomyces sp. HUAS 15-9]UXY29273.1 hypothetical protein N8I87_23750 [Streptomyces sp. HUAS 15-9]
MRRTAHTVSAAALVGLIAGTTAPVAFAAPAELVDALRAAPQSRSYEPRQDVAQDTALVPSEQSQQDLGQGPAQEAVPGDIGQDTGPVDIPQDPSLNQGAVQDPSSVGTTLQDTSGQQPALDPAYGTTSQVDPASVLPQGNPPAGTMAGATRPPGGVSADNASNSPIQSVVIQNPVNNSNEQGSHNVSHDNGNNNRRDEGRDHGGFFPGPFLGGFGNLGTSIVAIPRGTAGVSGVSNVVPGPVAAGEGGSIKSPVPTFIAGGALVALGCAAAAHRLWLRRRRMG